MILYVSFISGKKSRRRVSFDFAHADTVSNRQSIRVRLRPRAVCIQHLVRAHSFVGVLRRDAINKFELIMSKVKFERK